MELLHVCQKHLVVVRRPVDKAKIIIKFYTTGLAVMNSSVKRKDQVKGLLFYWF